MTMPCPHCQHVAYIRTSAQITPLLRELRYACRNDACGHTFVAYTEVSYTTSPSACPSPAINLPLSKSVLRRELIDQLAAAPEAQPRRETAPGDGTHTTETASIPPAQGVSAHQISSVQTGRIPNTEERLLTLDQVRWRVRHVNRAFSMATRLGTFPRPVNQNARPVQWRESEVQHWLNQQPLPQPTQP